MTLFEFFAGHEDENCRDESQDSVRGYDVGY